MDEVIVDHDAMRSEGVHAHIIPLHTGWGFEETIEWLGRGFKLPEVEPAGWMNLIVPVMKHCPICNPVHLASPEDG